MGRIPGSLWFHYLDSVPAMFQKINETGTCAALLLDKYVEWSQERGFKPEKKEHFERILNAKSPLSSQAYNRLRERRYRLPHCLPFTLTTQSRVAIGLGEDCILENSVSLHHLFGFPVLPGSAIKGVTYHFVAENELASSDEICRIFGSPADTAPDKARQSGGIVFFDAWPETYRQKNGLAQYLEMEVMTPHFQRYYQDKDWPRDNQDPNPIFFLVIKSGIRFEFAIAPSSKTRSMHGVDRCIPLATIQGWIRHALAAYGAGAKTGSGYGYFS